MTQPRTAVSLFAPKRPTEAHWWPTPLLGALGGAVAVWANGPLPWMIGALVAVALFRSATGCLIRPIPHGTKVGQWIIAIGIGLHFNQEVFHQILQHLGLIALGTLLTLLSSLIGISLHRCGGETPATAFFASMPGGANEMVNLGKRHGADMQTIAASQSLRMLLILFSVPLAYSWLFEHAPPSAPTTSADVWILLGLTALGGSVAWWFQHRRIPNAWQLGPLFVTMILCILFDLHTHLPSGSSAVGQWLIGTTLGCYFDRSFFQRAPHFFLRAVLATGVMLVLCMPSAWLLGFGSGLYAPALMLGLIPGGIAEMSLTAESLNLLVPLVTAMQVLRLLVVLFGADLAFRGWMLLRARPQA